MMSHEAAGVTFGLLSLLPWKSAKQALARRGARSDPAGSSDSGRSLQPLDARRQRYGRRLFSEVETMTHYRRRESYEDFFEQ